MSVDVGPHREERVYWGWVKDCITGPVATHTYTHTNTHAHLRGKVGNSIPGGGCLLHMDICARLCLCVCVCAWLSLVAAWHSAFVTSAVLFDREQKISASRKSAHDTSYTYTHARALRYGDACTSKATHTCSARKLYACTENAILGENASCSVHRQYVLKLPRAHLEWHQHPERCAHKEFPCRPVQDC